MKSKKKTYKKLSEEDDRTIWADYNANCGGFLSYREMAFFIFMIALYYLGLARWLFWFILVVSIIASIMYVFNKIPTYSMILRKELIKRGYKI